MKKINTALLIAVAVGGNLAAYAQETVNADNTALNKRDRYHGNPTAQDQSNTKSAVKTTAELRRKIVGYKGLSMDAKNVKLIDENGCMTLRGPVESMKEKEIIESLTKECFGDAYKNELEVKTRK
jgi:osmotically-inducible protein OsmY